MANLILSNNSSQVETTISQLYCRLTGSFSGPLNASVSPNSGFLIQNGNKQSGLFVGNTCFTFYNNYLNFEGSNTDVIFDIPNTKNFIVTGNGSVMTFNSNGTLAVGTSIDTNFKGLQVVNSSPIFLLKDTDAVNQSGNQAISFYDSNSVLFTSLCNEAAATINTGISVVGNATNLIYNKFFKLKNNSNNSSTNTFISSGRYLTLFSGDCLNSQYNFAVGGSSFFTSDLTSNASIISSGLCTLSNNSYLKGSGDNVIFNICNNKTNSTGSLYFYNASNGLHSSINVNQTSAGDSKISFYTTPIGAYSSLDRRSVALEISGNRNSRFYGCILGETGYFNSFIRANGIENSGCRTFIGRGNDGFHYFASNSNNCSYGISIDANSVVLNQVWLTSGRSSMCLDFNQNLTITGCLLSSGINSNSSLIVNNLYNTDSCIASRCITFRATGNNQNIIACGNFINYGSTAIFSGICSTGNQLNNISGCICLQNNLYVNSICMTAGNGICGPSGCFTTCIQAQVVCSNSCVRADSICSTGSTLNCFSTSICTPGYIYASNTVKAWGIYGVNAGLNTTLTGWNIKSVNIYQTNAATSNIYAYGICFNDPIKYPFIADFDVYSSGNPIITGHGNNPQTATAHSLGFSGALTTALVGASATLTSPYSIQFYALSGKCSSTNTLAPYVAGSTYSEVYFNFVNSRGPTTPYSELTRANACGIVHFSILGI